MKKLFLFFAILCVQSLPMWASSFKVLNIDPNGGANTMIAHNLISDIGNQIVCNHSVSTAVWVNVQHFK